MSWPVVALKTVCDIQMGSAPKGETYVELDNGIPLVAGAADYGEIYPSPKKSTTAPTKLCKKGDLIICVRATIGDLNWADNVYCLGRGVAGLRAKPELSSKYLFYFIKAHEHILYRNSTGSTFPQINRKIIEQLEIPLPSLPIQKQIAAVLEKADTLRSQCQQMEQELNSLAQSVFLDMFGDPVANPYDWLKLPLAELSEVKGGLQVTHKRETNPIEVPYLRVANVYRDYLALEEIKTIKVTEKELERTKLLKGDMLVVEGHGNKLEIGRTSIWDDSIENCTHQNHLIRVRFDNTKIRPQFVSCYLNSEGGRLQVLSLSKTTSGLNTISANNVRSINLIVPPLDMQDKYLKIHDEIQSKVMLCNENRLLLQENFNSLMQRAFKGELELKDVA